MNTVYSVVGIRNGVLWAWGQNNYGQLGDGTTIERLSPVQIGIATNWTKLTATNWSTLALRADGTLWGWGSNIWSNLAGVSGPSTTQIGSATNWVDVTASTGYYTLAVRGDGTLWAWGNNSNGQLGDGTKTDRATPTQIGTDTDWVQVAMSDSYASFARKSNGSLWSWGYNYYGDLGLGFSGQAQNRSVFTAVALP